MNILISLLFAVIGLIALLVILALFIKKDYYVKREILINAPLQKVLKNQNPFNIYTKGDHNRKETYTGTEGT